MELHKEIVSLPPIHCYCSQSNCDLSLDSDSGFASNVDCCEDEKEQVCEFRDQDKESKEECEKVLDICESISKFHPNADISNSEYSSFRRLVQLELIGLNIEEISDDVIFPPNLAIINFSKNQLTSLPYGIANLKNIQQLNVSDNQISHESYCFQSYRSLKRLDLSSNQLKRVPKWVKLLVNVSSIDLENNPIGNSMEPFKNTGLDATGKMIRSINLNNCALSEFPIHITHLKDVRNVSCCNKVNHNNLGKCVRNSNLFTSKNRNVIYSIPDEISGLKWLCILRLSNLDLVGLPEGMFHLKHLKELYIDGNKLEEIPSVILKLEKLRILDVSCNNLYYLPRNIKSMLNLLEINLSYNGISNIPEDLHELQYIRTIDLYNNKLKIDDIIPLLSLTPLEELDVSKNLFNVSDIENDIIFMKYMNQQNMLRSKFRDGTLRTDENDNWAQCVDLNYDYYNIDGIYPPIMVTDDESQSIDEDSKHCSQISTYSEESYTKTHEEWKCKVNVFEETGFALSGTYLPEPSICSEVFQNSEWDENESDNDNEWDFRNVYGTSDPKPSPNYDFDRLHIQLDLGPSTLIPSDLHAEKINWYCTSENLEIMEDQFEDAD